MGISANTWETWIVKADQYMKAVAPAGRKSKFSNSIRYNMLSMSFESYVMAIMDFHRTLPENHTYSDLVAGLETVMPISDSLKKRILQYENIQSICSVEKYHIQDPTDEELIDLEAAIREIGDLAHDTCVVQQNVPPQ
jgi:hypothetical protein